MVMRLQTQENGWKLSAGKRRRIALVMCLVLILLNKRLPSAKRKFFSFIILIDSLSLFLERLK
jgi:hypothetical protein